MTPMFYQVMNNPRTFRPRSSHPPSGRGVGAFTLVEMLTVVAIVGILSYLALPMLKSTTDVQLRGAVSQLIGDIAFTQSQSVTHGDAPRVLVFDINTKSYWIAIASSSATPITNPQTKTPYKVTYGTGGIYPEVTLSSYSLGGDNKLGFGVYGQLDQSGSATVTLASGLSTITVMIDPVTGECTTQ